MFCVVRGLYESSRAVNNGWRFTARTKFRSNRLIKKLCKWFRKMKIAQNLWIRLTPEQFSHLPQVISYPGMHSLCLSMRFRKSCTQESVFFMTPKNRDFHEISSFLESCREASRKLLGCLESVLECFRVSRNDFWTPKKIEKMTKIRVFFAIRRDFHWCGFMFFI